MSSSTKLTPEKKSAEKITKKSTKTLTPSSSEKRNSETRQTSNGVSSNCASSAEKGVEANQTPTSASKSGNKKEKQKRKRERSEERDESKAANKFPMERVRRIMRTEDSDVRITNEAVFLVNKATEKFLEKFSGEAHACCVQDRKKSLSYNHLSSAVSIWERYFFLSDFVPMKVKAKDALAEIKTMEPEASL